MAYPPDPVRVSDRGVVDTAALKVWADTALREAHSRPSWREGLSVGEAAGLAGDVLALLEHIRKLEDQLRLVARTLEPIAYPGKQLLGGDKVARGGGDA